MYFVEAVIDRLKLLPPTVLRSVEGIADMQALMVAKRLPQVTPAAHVVPAGLQGLQPLDVAGGYIQQVMETVGVAVTLRGNDTQGKGGIDRASLIIRAIIEQLSGWAPDDAFSQFQFSRGAVLSLDQEGLVYLLEFQTPFLLRSDT
jgi:hypothetical protein